MSNLKVVEPLKEIIERIESDDLDLELLDIVQNFSDKYNEWKQNKKSVGSGRPPVASPFP